MLTYQTLQANIKHQQITHTNLYILLAY